MLASPRVLIESLLESVANNSIVYSDWCWHSAWILNQEETKFVLDNKLPETLTQKEAPVSANDMLSVTAVPERAQWNVFEYQQRWNLKYLVDISKDLASYRKELKSSYGTDWQKEVVDSIIWLKFGNWYNWGDLKVIPDMYEPSLYNFFKWKWLNHLAEQIDSLIQDVIDIDNTEDEEEYEPDLNYAD